MEMGFTISPGGMRQHIQQWHRHEAQHECALQTRTHVLPLTKRCKWRGICAETITRTMDRQKRRRVP